MKLATMGALAETHLPNDSEVTRFSIKTSPKLMWLMIDSLYSDKAKAILREFAINAWEVSEGRPIEVFLPTFLDTNLRITDTGPGLSESDIRRLFTTMGESTKDQDNNSIGGFGIGCKAWAGYSSQITVISRFGGEETTYQLYRDGDELYLTKLGSVPTDKHSGLTIEVPVKNNDQYLFRDAAQKVFKHFNPKPQGINVPNPEYTFESDHYRLCRSDPYNPIKPHVVMGMIEYPLDKDVLRPQLMPEEAHLLELPLELEFKVGELSIAPSREALSYDKSTIKKIAAKLHLASLRLVDDIVEDIESQPTEWAKRMVLSEWNRKLPHVTRLLEQRNPKPSVVDVRQDFDLRQLKAEAAWCSSSERHRARFPIVWIHQETVWVKSNVKVIWVDTQNHLRERIKHRYGSEKTNLLLFKCSENDLESVLKELGNPDYEKLSDLDLPATIKAAPRRTTKVRKVLKLETSDWVETDHDVSKGGVYLLRDRGSLQFVRQGLDPIHDHSLQQLINWANSAFGENINLYALNKTAWDIPNKNPNWITLEKWAKDFIQRHNKTITKILSAYKVGSISLWHRLKELIGEIEHNDFRRLYDELDARERAEKGGEFAIILERLMRSPFNIPPYPFDFVKHAEKISAKHPLVYHLLVETPVYKLVDPSKPVHQAIVNHYNRKGKKS